MIAKNVSTTPTIALFVIISATGTLLLLHAGSGNVKILHEWLGLVFIVFGLMHVAANWRLVLRYLVGWKAVSIALLIALAAGFALIPSEHGADNPVKSTYRQAIATPISTLALLYAIEPQQLVERLKAEGLAVDSLAETPQDIARKAKVQTDRIMALIAADTGL